MRLAVRGNFQEVVLSFHCRIQESSSDHLAWAPSTSNLLSPLTNPRQGLSVETNGMQIPRVRVKDISGPLKV